MGHPRKDQRGPSSKGNNPRMSSSYAMAAARPPVAFRPDQPPPPIAQALQANPAAGDNLGHFLTVFQQVAAHYQRLLDAAEERERRLEARFARTETKLEESLARIQALERRLASSGGHQHHRRYQEPSRSENTPLTNDYLDRLEEIKNKGPIERPGSKIVFYEKEEDLFSSKEGTIVHSVPADLRCDLGLAGQCAKRFGKPPAPTTGAQVGDVLAQDAGALGTLLSLVTKDKAPYRFQKRPEAFLDTIKVAFDCLFAYFEEHKVRKIAMPRLCSGLDGLAWPWVKDELLKRSKKLRYIPKGSALEVHVYHLPPRAERRPTSGAPALEVDGPLRTINENKDEVDDDDDDFEDVVGDVENDVTLSQTKRQDDAGVVTRRKNKSRNF
ncbi:Hypothetical predicted protein [Cloeon dipterum]|uniref:Uncharacterized protein n=1 Tax=Cloeon dipterum TaxID=197152 RepID=A0A8S1E031_9INSE|nr:Hypothetical predicted protein [Cloeon dipterum]CAB3387855.1 Hypothetical predicted protein [Cloeon dipterum]